MRFVEAKTLQTCSFLFHDTQAMSKSLRELLLVKISLVQLTLGNCSIFAKCSTLLEAPPVAAVPNVSPQISSPRTVIFQSGTVCIQSGTVRSQTWNCLYSKCSVACQCGY